jgi:intein-encoded DNA endonuclease-like protein
MNDLLANIEQIHTTELGIMRIKRNLELETDDVVSWCKNKVKEANSIIKNGKNWYVCVGDSVITINAKSYTIITAHKKKLSAAALRHFCS